MDSVTQFALGACVGAAMLGPRIGMRKAAVIGGLMGTVPDLDTFIPNADPVAAFTSHRGASHSLIIQALATPLFAEPLVRLFRDLGNKRVLSYAAVYLIFATHALIDAMTIYGTRLLWPLVDTPFGVGSIFIIDPIYTLPLLAVTLWALILNPGNPGFGRWLKGALIVSTVYMLGTIGLQGIAERKADAWITAHGLSPQRTLSIATPFNVLYWRTIVIDGDRYLNLYTSLLGDTVSAYRHPRHPELEGCLIANPAFRDLTAFTKGFYRVEETDGKIIFSDLRMGLTPNYVFRFQLGEIINGAPHPGTAPLREPTVRDAPGDLQWLWSGILGEAAVRTAEAAAYQPLDERLSANRVLVMPSVPGPC
ncbi:MAG: metal-dependent hydrolase [Rhodospirillales bacterium]